jgi:hypothetical protein
VAFLVDTAPHDVLSRRHHRATEAAAGEPGEGSHVCEALIRFDASLERYLREQRQWQDRLLKTLDRLDEQLGAAKRRP